jgi:hypothetical protein
VCLRVESADYADPDTLNDQIADLLALLGVKPKSADVLIDLKEIAPNSEATTRLVVREMVRSLPMLKKWRTVTVAASAFPRNLSEVDAEDVSVLRRTEWVVWNSIRIAKDKLPRPVAFGDYGIRHPHFAPPKVDPKKLITAPNIRYTAEEDWIVLKGRKPKTPTEDRPEISYRDLCRKLMERGEWCQPEFSWGDGVIRDCADGSEGCGNATTWTAASTSHHLAYVKLQLSSLRGS